MITHSWGTLPAGGFAASRPDLVDRLVLFGPIARREGSGPLPVQPDTRQITVQDQYDRFVADVPKGAMLVLSDAKFAEWGAAYLASELDRASLSLPAVTVPSGPARDIAAAWQGTFPYDPTKVLCAVLIVRKEWDSLATDRDAAWLYDAFSNASDKQDTKLTRATHLAHLETGRFALHRATRNFLAAGIPSHRGATGPLR